MIKNLIQKYRYYFFLHILLFVNSFNGVLIKKAGHADFLSFDFIIYYGLVLFILMIYAFFWQILLKRLQLVSAYANKAGAMIWVMLWGVLFFKESISINMAIGLVIVLSGVGLVITADE